MGMGGFERQHQPVEETPPLTRAAVNSRSIAGVSHSTDSHSPSEFTAAGTPLIRTCRRSGAAARVPVPTLISPGLRERPRNR